MEQFVIKYAALFLSILVSITIVFIVHFSKNDEDL